MKPLIESDLAVLAILLLLIGVCALVSWLIERRAWFRRGVLPNTQHDVLPPPNVRSQRPQPDPYREWIIEE